MLKVTDHLSRTQKLPNSLWLLRDDLESKRPLFEAKLRASEKKLDKTLFQKSHPSDLSAMLETQETPGMSINQADLHSELEISRAKVEALTRELQ